VPEHRWLDNIRKYLKDIGLWEADWIGLAQDRDTWWDVVNAGMNFTFQ